MPRFRNYKYALVPTTRQERVMHCLVDGQCEIYNAALQERRDTYRLATRRGVAPPRVDFSSQCRDLTCVRSARSDLAAFGVAVSQGTLRRVDRAFAGFFRRLRAGETPGYPRYRSFRRFDSVTYGSTRSWKLDSDTCRLYLQGIGHVKVRLHRPVPNGGRLRSCVVRRERVLRRRGKPSRARWVVCIAVALPDAEPLAKTNRRCGVDVGVRQLVSIVDDLGTPTQLPNPRPLARAQDRLVAAQRRVARAERGSNRRSKAVHDLAVAHARVADTRSWWTHQISHDLVARYDLIAIEDLPISNMTRSARGTIEHPGTNVAAKAGLNRSILDAGWGQLRAKLFYKAEGAGRELIAVNPAFTSQTCNTCGHIEADNRFHGHFACRRCGHEADADINAAANILKRAESARQRHAA